MKFRKILAVALCVSFAFALPVQAQNPFSTAGLQAWKQSITAAGQMGAPRFTTALAPTCSAANVSALIWDTTLTGLYVCNGSAYVSTGLSLSSLNEFTGQTNISGPDATTNVEIGSGANDANAGTGGTSTVIGNNATNSGNAVGSICIGSVCAISATGANNVVIGTGSTLQGVAGSSHIKIGPAGTCSSTGNNNIMIGNTVTCLTNSANSLMVGATAVNTGSNQAVFGGASFGYLDVWFGEGVTDTTALGWVLHGTGGSGADNAGGSITIAAGQPTGSGTGGNVILQAAPSGTTSSTLQTLETRQLVVAKSFALSDAAAAATFLVMTLGNDTGGGGIISYCVTARDATNEQIECGQLQFAGVDVTAGAGGETCTTPTEIGTVIQAVSAGTLATTWSASTGTDLCNVRLSADTSLTPSALYLKYTVTYNSGQALAAQ